MLGVVASTGGRTRSLIIRNITVPILSGDLEGTLVADYVYCFYFILS